MKTASRKVHTSGANDVSSYLNGEGHLRVLLVHKKSRLEIYEETARPNLNELIIRRDVSVDSLEQSDEVHRQSLQTVRRILGELRADLKECHRAELPTVDAQGRLVLTVGGDGTLLDAGHYFRHNPVLGINSDPLRSVGSLCAATPQTLKEMLGQILSGKMETIAVSRIAGVLDGKALPFMALNEFLIAHQNPAATSHYLIEVDGKLEEHKSSGIWIGAPAGSTAAIASAGGIVQDFRDHRMQVVVREPYVASERVPQLLHCFVEAPESIHLTSKMPAGHIYCDGPLKSTAFGLGSRLTLSCDGEPLRLFVTAEMEEKRKRIGKLRARMRAAIG